MQRHRPRESRPNDLLNQPEAPVDGHWTVLGRGNGNNGEGLDFRRTPGAVTNLSSFGLPASYEVQE